MTRYGNCCRSVIISDGTILLTNVNVNEGERIVVSCIRLRKEFSFRWEDISPYSERANNEVSVHLAYSSRYIYRISEIKTYIYR